MRHYFTEDPTEAEAKYWGMTVEEASAPPFSLWPENVQPMDVYRAMMTQWRMGMAGPTGFDYGALPAVLELHAVKKKQRRDVFEALRVLEDETLTIWAREREKNARKLKR